MSHATKQMRAAIERISEAVNEAGRVASRIELSDDAAENTDLRGMAVSIDNLLRVITTALERCEAEVSYAEVEGERE